MSPAKSDPVESKTQVVFGSKAAKPNLDRLLFKPGSNRLTAKTPLSVMNGKHCAVCSCILCYTHICSTLLLICAFWLEFPAFFFYFKTPEPFILNRVNQLGTHNINMETLMGKDLDQLAEVIAEALQEVDGGRPALGGQPRPGAADSRGEMEGNREPLTAMLLNQEQPLKSDKGQDLNQKDALSIKQQGSCLWSFGKRVKAGSIQNGVSAFCVIDVRVQGL